tara:strand:+ start:2322 stop:2483 length:162 start_codon:yes stop_codon:yes gene_type:complete
LSLLRFEGLSFIITAKVFVPKTFAVIKILHAIKKYNKIIEGCIQTYRKPSKPI